MTLQVLYQPSEIKALQAEGSVILFDVRDEADYRAGHIAGAVNVPQVFYHLCRSTPDGIADMHATFRRIFADAGMTNDTLAIFYEDYLQTRYGGSCRGFWLLNYLGHTKTGILYAGLISWTNEGNRLVTEPTTIRPGHFSIDPQPHLIATKDDVLAAIGNKRVILLDNRDKEEWLGLSSSPYGVDFVPRKGRIPGAQWIEWYEFMDLTKPIPPFKQPEEVRQLCAAQGLYPDDDIIIYCFKGSRASNTYIALKKAGFKKVRNYFASWNEWAYYPELPVEEGLPAETS